MVLRLHIQTGRGHKKIKLRSRGVVTAIEGEIEGPLKSLGTEENVSDINEDWSLITTPASLEFLISPLTFLIF